MSTTSHNADPIDTESTRKRKLDAPPRFCCGICGESFPTELLARVHLSRAEDADHLTIDGFDCSPVPIEVTDQDGAMYMPVLESRDPRDATHVNASDVPLEDPRLPKGADERHRLIIAAAASQYDAPYKEIAKSVSEHFREEGLEPLSYGTIRRVIRDYFQPAADQQPGSSDGEERLGDLTPTQQAVVISLFADPDATDAEIADRVGCARSYPSQVRDRAVDIIARIAGKHSAGTRLADAIAPELTGDDLTALRAHGYLDALGIDTGALNAAVTSDEADAEQPVRPDGAGTVTHEDAAAETAAQRRRQAIAEPTEPIPAAPIRRLYVQTRFYRRLAEETAGSPNAPELVFARRIEEELLTLLEGS